MPARQYEIRTDRLVARVDLAYPEARLAIEVDGYRHHSGRRAFDRDRERDNELKALGWQVIRITHRLIRDPSGFIEVVRTYLDDRLF